MTDHLLVLRRSVERLRDVASRLEPEQFGARAYPSEWSIADTFSHLGSGAVIGHRRLDDQLSRRESDPAFNQTVWDAWNAKDPTAQVLDSLTSDAAFLQALESSSEEQRETFQFLMGPFEFDFDGFVGLRLGEHVVHTWDIEVSVDPAATLSNGAANSILDRVQFVVQRTGKSSGEKKEIRLRTVDPIRDFTLVVDVDAVNLVAASHGDGVELAMPAEALVRAIYGRLDAEHCPTILEGPALDTLRRTFPGF